MATIRIIAGLLRRQTINVLNMPDLRPTPERLRESVFNSLGQNLQNLNVLDVFSGSGAMAFEAYSRGANVTALELNAKIFKHLQSTQTVLKSYITFKQVDAFEYLKQIDINNYDIYLFDPPYQLDAMAQIFNQFVQLIKYKSLNINKNLTLYCEHNQSLEPLIKNFTNHLNELNLHLSLDKTFKVGKIYAYLLRINSAF